MSMEMTDRTLGIWYIDTTEDSDWMGSIWLNEDGDEYTLMYRHRYYKDDKNFDSEDEKSWYSAKCLATDTTKEKMITTMREITSLMSKMCGSEVVEELMGPEGVHEFMERFEKLPFVHMKKENLH